MSQDDLPKYKNASVIIIIMVLIIGMGMFWKTMIKTPYKAILDNAYNGRLAKPTEPSLTDPLLQLLEPQQKFRPMRISHIPQIRLDKPMPHPFVGACINCHLIEGGELAGSQDKTIVGAMLEQVSKNVVKLGPTIKPESKRPHPPAGRCIKCHDIVVQVPINKKQFIWQ